MNQHPIVEYYRCPQELLHFSAAGPLKESEGYFCFGQDLICYGQTSGYPCATVTGSLFDASQHICRLEHTSCLPFNPAQVIDNLRYERYIDQSGQQRWLEKVWVKNIYYLLRPMLPVPLRKHLQK